MLSSQVKFSADTEGQTDRQMDMVKQYAPDLSMRGHKNNKKIHPFMRALLQKRK